MSVEDPLSRPARRGRTLLLTENLIERARNAVAWTRAVPGEAASFAALAERAISAEVERLEKLYNDGAPFPHGELRPGPAPGVMEEVARLRRLRRKAAGAPATQSPGSPGPAKPSARRPEGGKNHSG